VEKAANDLVVIAETEEDLIQRLNEWKKFWCPAMLHVEHYGAAVEARI